MFLKVWCSDHLHQNNLTSLLKTPLPERVRLYKWNSLWLCPLCPFGVCEPLLYWLYFDALFLCLKRDFPPSENMQLKFANTFWFQSISAEFKGLTVQWKLVRGSRWYYKSKRQIRKNEKKIINEVSQGISRERGIKTHWRKITKDLWRVQFWYGTWDTWKFRYEHNGSLSGEQQSKCTVVGKWGY